MDNRILNFLQEITDEEKQILSSNRLNSALYTSSNDFTKVEYNKVLKNGNLINIRPHTRFIDFPQHSHEFVEILYCLQGNITNIINGQQINMSKGDILFLNRNISHGIKKSNKNDLGINFFIKHNFLHESLLMLKQHSNIGTFVANTIKNDEKDGQFLFYKTDGNLQIANTLENIILSFIMNKNLREININKKLIGILFLYLEQTHSELKNNVYLNNKISLAKNIISNYIDNEYTTATLVEISDKLNMTIFQASKFIKDNFGQTFKEMLQHKRFNIAKKLLIETDISIYDIMLNIGYENSSYFYRKFKKFFKKSPAEYRRLHKTAKKHTFLTK